MNLPEQVVTVFDVKPSKGGIVRMPLFGKQSIVAGFSWGVDAPNMRGEDAIPHKNRFFKDLGIPSPPRVLLKSVNYNNDEILTATQGNLARLLNGATEHGINTHADVLITDVPNLSLVVTPADCTVSVICGQKPDGDDVLGVLHSGLRETMTMVPATMIREMVKFGCEPGAMLVAVAPSIQQDNYWVKSSEINDRTRMEWGNRAKDDTVERDGEVVKFDVLARVLDIMIGEGVNPSNVMAYAVDTFEAALNGESFSHRASTFTGECSYDGRFIVAAAIVG